MTSPATLSISIWKLPCGVVSERVTQNIAQKTYRILKTALEYNQTSLNQTWSPWFVRSLGAIVTCAILALVAYSQSQTVSEDDPDLKDGYHQFKDLMVTLAKISIASAAITGIGCLYRKGCLFQIGRQITSLEATFKLGTL